MYRTCLVRHCRVMLFYIKRVRDLFCLSWEILFMKRKNRYLYILHFLFVVFFLLFMWPSIWALAYLHTHPQTWLLLAVCDRFPLQPWAGWLHGWRQCRGAPAQTLVVCLCGMGDRVFSLEIPAYSLPGSLWLGHHWPGFAARVRA